KASGCEYGVYNDDYVEYGSSLEIRGNSITNIVDPDGVVGGTEAYGIYPCDDYIDYGSIVTICDNIVTTSGPAATYTLYIYYGVEDCSTFICCNNTFTGPTQAYIYFDDELSYGSYMEVSNNQMLPGDAGGPHYGFWWDTYDVYEGSTFAFARNNVQ